MSARTGRIACLLLLAGACAHPGRLSSRCSSAAPRTTWQATGHDGRLEGQVRDRKEGTPIGNMELVLDGGTVARRSDAAGAFVFDGVAEGRHVLTTNAAAYLPLGDTLVMPVRGGLRGSVELALRKDVLTKCELYRQ